jgi:heme exporter protein CcmD
MTEGIVTGGWEFVWAAYGLTAAVLVIYTISVIARLRDARRNTR